MAEVTVQNAAKSDKLRPFLEEMEKRFDDVRRRAFEVFESRRRGLGHAFDDWLQAEREVMGWSAAELEERDTRYDLAMTLPGYDAKDVQVTATPTEIIVHANVEKEAKKEDVNCVWTEFQSNEVLRHFRLPDEIDVENTKATLDKGMLHVTAPKKAKAEPQAVEVKIS